MDHDIIPELIKKINRFRSINQDSFYSLAKDLARLTADSLDASAMQTIVKPPDKEKWGSLKSLENLLSIKNENKFIRKIIAPLIGVYELRHANAHLPGKNIEDAFKLIIIDKSQPFVHQVFMLLNQVIYSLYEIAKCLKNWTKI
jgi:hypothetical protein